MQLLASLQKFVVWNQVLFEVRHFGTWDTNHRTIFLGWEAVNFVEIASSATKVWLFLLAWVSAQRDDLSAKNKWPSSNEDRNYWPSVSSSQKMGLKSWTWFCCVVFLKTSMEQCCCSQQGGVICDEKNLLKDVLKLIVSEPHQFNFSALKG